MISALETLELQAFYLIRNVPKLLNYNLRSLKTSLKFAALQMDEK